MHETLVARPLEAPVLEPITPRKPSEALRLGRLTRPLPLHGFVFAGGNAACAVGAIAVGLGFDPERFKESSLEQAIGALALVEAHMPWPIKHGVIDRNDHARLSDDQIVAWLEGQGL